MVRIFSDGIPANGFTYSVNSEIYQDAALNRVPEDLVAGLMETAERDFRRGLLQELMTAAERFSVAASLVGRPGDGWRFRPGCSIGRPARPGVLAPLPMLTLRCSPPWQRCCRM